MAKLSTIKFDAGIKKRDAELELNAFRVGIDLTKTKAKESAASLTDMGQRKIDLEKDIVRLYKKKDELIADLRDVDDRIQKRKNVIAAELLDLELLLIGVKENIQHKTETEKELEIGISKLKKERVALVDDVEEKKKLCVEIKSLTTTLSELNALISKKQKTLSGLDKEIRDRQKKVFEKEIALNQTSHDISVYCRRLQKEYNRLDLGKIEFPIEFLERKYPKRRSETVE